MRIVCCYTKLNPATEKAIEQHAPGTEMVHVQGDAFAYYKELDKRWGGDDDLVTIEHDIEIRADVIPAFENCDSDWCVFPYWHRRQADNAPMLLTTSLGCSKFSAKARQAASRKEMCRVWIDCAMCHIGVQFEKIPACWLHIDAKMSALLADRGITPCVHEPEVTHHREW
jgi:hypothetical protein